MDTFIEAAMKVGRGPLSAAEVAEAMNSERRAISRVQMAPSEVAAAIRVDNILSDAAAQISLNLARDVDVKLEAFIKVRLGVNELDTNLLVGRLQRIYSPATGAQVYLLDGRTLARVYPASYSNDGTVITYTQVVEGLEG